MGCRGQLADGFQAACEVDDCVVDRRDFPEGVSLYVVARRGRDGSDTVRFGGGLAAGGALAAAALSRAERRPDMFVCSLTFSRGVGRSQSNGLRSGCFTGLPRHGEPPECGSCRALAIGVRRRLPHVSRDAGRGRGITQSNRRGTRRGKGYFSPPNQWLALPKSGRTCSSPDKKRI